VNSNCVNSWDVGTDGVKNKPKRPEIPFYSGGLLFFYQVSVIIIEGKLVV